MNVGDVRRELKKTLPYSEYDCEGEDCGIYLVNINKFLYIGQTHDFVSRKVSHKESLKKGVHCNPFMQNVWNVYKNAKPYSFTRLRYCHESELNTFEQYAIDALVKLVSPEKIMNIQKKVEPIIRDETNYIFSNKQHGLFKGTRYDLRREHNVSLKEIVSLLNTEEVEVQGWKLLK